MVVEAAWTASRAPGPLRAFYRCIKNRRGFPVAVAATACKMTVLCWLGDVVDQLVDDRSFGDGLEGGEAGQRVEER